MSAPAPNQTLALDPYTLSNGPLISAPLPALKPQPYPLPPVRLAAARQELPVRRVHGDDGVGGGAGVVFGEAVDAEAVVGAVREIGDEIVKGVLA